ncbi:hypothetical protein MNBD_GAMMA23-249 [hydrothermal vent metagenome]|uniref:Uncharacterized protein n=1 Tax=hydrothermal vent metagenome TaxID=652676 RepID=A0A3B0ZSK7_9ZZZZ
MLNTESQYRLVFCTNSDIQLTTLLNGLNNLGFIGKAVFSSSAEQEYCAGDSFLQSLTFMGCSPYIEFEPPTQLKPDGVAGFCFIRVLATKGNNTVYHAEQLDKLKTIPRCKHCRKVISDWVEQAVALNVANHWKHNCPSCGDGLTHDDLDWRKASGSGNLFIEVVNVYLQEAVPTDAFLQQLETISSSPWQYFYTDSNIKTKLLDSQ